MDTDHMNRETDEERKLRNIRQFESEKFSYLLFHIDWFYLDYEYYWINYNKKRVTIWLAEIAVKVNHLFENKRVKVIY